MSSHGRLFDEKGRLLSPEQCNIKPLESLTKGRAKSPSRRSPSRNGKHSPGNERSKRLSSTKLPTFVKEVNRNDITSPTALRGDSNLIKQDENRTNNGFTSALSKPREDKHLANSTAVRNELIARLRRNAKKETLRRKMESNGVVESEQARMKAKLSAYVAIVKKQLHCKDWSFKDALIEKHVSQWTNEDVCVWLDLIGLNSFKESFVSQGVTGKTLLNLNYETLENVNDESTESEQLKLSDSSEEREHFLAEVYNLQQHNKHADDEAMDREIQETLQGIWDNDKDEPVHVALPLSRHLNTGNDRGSSGSVVSSRANSEHGGSPTGEMHGKPLTKEENGPQSKQVTSGNNSHESHRTTANQGQVPKSRKESSKHGGKKRKPPGKRFSRFFSSFHQTNKSSSILDTAPPIYKNVFHDVMKSGPKGVIKVWTEMFLTDMQYVSLLVNHEATAFEVIKMVLEKSNAQEDAESYRICEINERNDEYILDRNECPLQRERQWSDPDNCRFELRWRNERLIDWGNSSGSVAQDFSLQKSDKDSAVDHNHVEPVKEETTPKDQEEEPVSNRTSPNSENSEKPALETSFEYNVEQVYSVDTSGSEEKQVTDSESPKTMSDEGLDTTAMSNGVRDNEITGNLELRSNEDSMKNFGSSLLGTKHLTSSCPDLTSPELFKDNLKVDLIPLSAESADEETMADDEFAYSQKLRSSSKKLSRRLRLETDKTRREGQGEKEGVEWNDKEDREAKSQDVTDGSKTAAHESINGLEGHYGTSEDNQEGPTERLIGDHSGIVGETVEVNVLGEHSQLGEHSEKPGEDHVPEVESPKNMSMEVDELLNRIKDLETENSLLSEENRNLKKSCRTFEGKSRLKEREVEELEEEKNDLAVQVQEMAADLHVLRAENTELRTSLAEANTKLNDVDGWVTRDVFEDIRGQLSVSLEEVEEMEEEVNRVKKKMQELEVENKRIKDLESEIERLNERIKEDEKDQEGIKKDLRDKLSQIRDLDSQMEKLRDDVTEGEKEKKDLEKKLEEAKNDIDRGNKKHAGEIKDLQKRLSDRDYEILIMKEEKKELCVKMKSFENNVETLREEMKIKESEHEAVIAEMNQQSEIKDQSLSVMVSNLEELVNERDLRIKQLKKQIELAGKPESELQAKEHEYEQNKVYLKHLIALVREKDPDLLDSLNQTLSSRDSDDWC